MEIAVPHNSKTRIWTVFCANAVLVTALLPYLSPVVLQTVDAQLMGFATSVAVILWLLFLEPGRLSFYRCDLYILCAGLLSLIYINPDAAPKDFLMYARGCAPIVLGFPIYFATRNLYRYMSPGVFIAVVGSYVGALLLQVASPGAHAAIVGHFMNRVQSEIGARASGLCDEPSYMGEMCILFIISLYFFHREYWKQHKRAAWAIVIASLAMLVITKSALGFVGALIIALVAIFSSRVSGWAKAAVIPAVVIAAVLMGNLLSLSNSRGAVMGALLLKHPLLIFQDISFADRCIGPLTAFYGLRDSPFGTGEVKINVDAMNKAFGGEIARIIWPTPDFQQSYIDMTNLGGQHLGFAGMVERMGVFGVLILLLLICSIDGFQGKWVVRVFILALLMNSSMFLSTLWFVIGCCLRPREGKPLPTNSGLLG